MLLSKVLRSYTFIFIFNYATGLSLAVFVLLGGMYSLYAYDIYSDIEDSLNEELARFQNHIAQGGISAAKAVVRDHLASDALNPNYYLLVDANYNKLAGNLDAWPDDMQSFGYSWLQFDMRQFELRRNDNALPFGAVVSNLRGGSHLLVARKLSHAEDKINLMVRLLIRGMFVTILMGALGGAIISSLLMRRVESFNRTIKEIMSGDLSKRLPVNMYSGDFRELEINLNNMLDRIQSLMAGVRRVSDNIAHDLRTPLTRMRSHIDQLAETAPPENQEIIGRLRLEADDLLGTFNAALRIARIETGNRDAELLPHELRMIVQDVVELYEPVAADKNIAINMNLCDQTDLMGDRDLLFQAVANLVDNAIKYTPEGGIIEIELELAGNRCVLCVKDSGIGIPKDDKHRVFERFYRVETSRGEFPGNGLGLSLVAAVIKYHDGLIDLEDNDPGLVVRIELPKTHAPIDEQ
jgi:signal transduction histidine kinase